MGTDAKTGRRAVIDRVRECITLVNACVALANDGKAGLADVQAKHNTLAAQTRVDVVGLGSRIDGVEARCARLELSHIYADGTLTTHEGALQRHQHFMAGLSLGQRLRWLLTGRIPLSQAAAAREVTTALSDKTRLAHLDPRKHVLLTQQGCGDGNSMSATKLDGPYL